VKQQSIRSFRKNSDTTSEHSSNANVVRPIAVTDPPDDFEWHLVGRPQRFMVIIHQKRIEICIGTHTTDITSSRPARPQATSDFNLVHSCDSSPSIGRKVSLKHPIQSGIAQ
jgi:hypothetical protein